MDRSSCALITSVAAAYFVAAKLSLLLAFEHTIAVPVWPPSGIALSTVIILGYRVWPGIFAGAFIGNFLTLLNIPFSPASSATVALCASIGNVLETLAAAYIVNRSSRNRGVFDNLKGLFVFVTIGCFAATMISATTGVTSFCILRSDWSEFNHLWLTWWLGDTIGILIVTPVILMMHEIGFKTLNRNLLFEVLLVGIALSVSIGGIFWRIYPVGYLIIPLLIWIFLGLRRFETSAVVLLVSSITLVSTAHGVSGMSHHESIIFLQAYIALTAITALFLLVSLRSETNLKYTEKKLHEYQDHLEDIVKERTETLVETNARLAVEIEERTRIEKALSYSEQKYRDLVESANSVIMRWRPDGIITFFNTFAQSFFGYSEKEIIGRNVFGTIVLDYETSGRDLNSLLADIVANPEAYAQNENENIRKDGDRVWISWTNRPIVDEHGKIVEILSVGNDITARKRSEEELRRTLVELASAKEQAETADHLKSAFLATMSHELRTPLNSIIGFTGIILKGLAGPVNEEQNKQLSMVKNSADHLLNLINDILDISKIESGQLTISSNVFDLRSSVEKAASSLRALADAKGLSLRTDLAPGISSIISDQRRVEQILLNLIGNAIKFTDSGEIGVVGRIKENMVQISVVDTGIGIKDEDMANLFKPFQQLESGITRKYEGSGLGLSICKKLVQLLGGEITVRSVVGKGSTFTFTLPVSGGVS
jgi:PAS domain S-box-containing protein